MSLIDRLFGKKESSAKIAKGRLIEIIVARPGGQEAASSDFLAQLQKEILEVVRRYYPISEEQIEVSLQTEGESEVLGLSITLDQKTQTVPRRSAPRPAEPRSFTVQPRNPPRNAPRTSF